MAQWCRVCHSPRRAEIDAALIAHKAGYAKIAEQFGLKQTSVYNHATTHLRETIAWSKELAMLADTQSLIAEMNRLHAYVNDVLEQGKANGDPRLVLQGVREGRGNVETLAKLGPLGDIERRLEALEQDKEHSDDDDAASD